MTHAGTLDAAFSGRLGDFTLDVAFQAPRRGVTALFGPSGSGKTTVLRCVAGLTRLPGRLAVDGDCWQDDARGLFRKPHMRAVGYVFQEPSLFPHLTVQGNLHYGRRRALRDGARSEKGRAHGLAADDVIDLLGLGPLMGRATGALSGGERQRVAIGRALLSQPRLLLMDEPLAALDRAAKEEILAYIEALNRRLSLPILYVSHDIAEVSRLAERLVVLSGGRKAADGTTAQVLERLDLHPETGRFEAGVLLTARVVRHDPAYHLTYVAVAGQTLTMPMIEAAPGSPVRLRVRARDVALATEKPRGISIRNILAGTVAELREEPGTAFAETLVDVGGQRLRARVTRAAVAELGLAPGRPVHALVKSIAFDRRALAGTPDGTPVPEA